MDFHNDDNVCKIYEICENEKELEEECLFGINNYLFDDYLLQKIKEYLIRDLFSSHFLSICYSIKALSFSNRKFAKNFDLLAFKLLLSSRMNDISFFPYKLISSFVYSPVRHDLSMIAYVNSWKSCQHCKRTMIDHLLSLHISKIYHTTSFFKDNFHLLFCQSHFNDLLSRDKFTQWNHAILVFIPRHNSSSPPMIIPPTGPHIITPVGPHSVIPIGPYTVTPRLEIFLDSSSWC
jgi:hypothetical protein